MWSPVKLALSGLFTRPLQENILSTSVELAIVGNILAAILNNIGKRLDVLILYAYLYLN